MTGWCSRAPPSTAPSSGGLITEVHSADGTPPFVVRWLDTGREAMVFPGPDAIVVTAAEQRSADERARERMTQVQETIRGR